MIKKTLANLVHYYSKLSTRPIAIATFHNPRSNPSSSSNIRVESRLHMDSASLSKKDDELRSKALRICSEHLGGPWSKISPAELSLTPLSGGMSNALYCCSLSETWPFSDDIPNQVLLRLYGDSARSADIELQLEIFSLLSMKQLGPKLYGNFDGGRLEELLPANPVKSEELSDHKISSIIAKKIAVVHSLDIRLCKNETWIFDRLEEWTRFINENVQDFGFDPKINPESERICRELLSIDYDQEVKFLHSLLDKSKSPIVFSHNDLHHGNILLTRCTKRRSSLEDRVMLIDFEYSSYNYRAYDIANHFTEWCFEYDTQKFPHFEMKKERFPSLDSQRNFLRAYLTQASSLMSTASSEWTAIGSQNVIGEKVSFSDSPLTNGHHSNGDCSDTKLEKQVDLLIEELKPFYMSANLLWTLWCIKSAKNSSIKFGYWEHALARWHLYSEYKATYLEDVSRYSENR